MSTATLAAAGAKGECNVLTLGAYRFAGLTAADCSPACGQLQGFFCLLCTVPNRAKCLFLLAEAVRFELTKGFPLLVFKSPAEISKIKDLDCFRLRNSAI